MTMVTVMIVVVIIDGMMVTDMLLVVIIDGTDIVLVVFMTSWRSVNSKRSQRGEETYYFS